MKRAALVAVVAVVQIGLVAVGVAPQLSARTTGETYRMSVDPVDPIDPFRGAYVDLQYPDLEPPEDFEHEWGDDIYVTLTERDGEMVGSRWSTTRPDSGSYVRCASGWPLRCGIESWFADQREARRIEEAMARDGAIAEVRVDSRGNAAIVGLEAR
ncbi:GDYXXLXY domain-containing protein [Nocardioides sp. Y6]|uniref:GDYXXLXY domain-containing protein n=1 Tax=Nocardioides malaquae TaxID=2773426 RepID=A0ABR9RTV8_9ACTN|nr:GDYXXLXY domain-containing protein [Nocardioides malaquae]MBE7325024.1 GDYXXLXY domain-containing protein [Nocardioides malaquae]